MMSSIHINIYMGEVLEIMKNRESCIFLQEIEIIVFIYLFFKKNLDIKIYSRVFAKARQSSICF